mmetsp:Transcript_130306/g.329030  ORF Transcript_130306/g.329030 Transcript_130306/m.329030 type:complete len:100 (+) Transcript_130306:2-301(+)
MFAFNYWGFRWLPCCSACCWQGQAGPDGSKCARCYPHGAEYPKDSAMLWGGDRFSCVRRGLCMALPACVVAVGVFAVCAALVLGACFATFKVLYVTEME